MKVQELSNKIMRQISFFTISLCTISLTVQTSNSAAQTITAAAAIEHRELLDRYCVGCHNDRTLTAGMSLERLDLSQVGIAPQETQTWEKVIRKLRTRAMPPIGRARPSESAYEALTLWLSSHIDNNAEANPNPGRRHAVHRLNRAEYANAIRDLLAIEIDEQALLPPDDSGFGFDNIADVLSVSPMLTERYLSAARKIGKLAVGDLSLQPTTQVFEVNKGLRQDGRVSDDLPFGSRGGLAVPHTFPVDGEYIAKIFLLRTYDGRIRGLTEPHTLEIRLDGTIVKSLIVGGKDRLLESNRGRGLDLRNVPDDGQEIRFEAKAGPATLSVSFIDKGSVLEGMRRPFYRVTSYEYAGDSTIPPGIESLELRGPYNVTGRGDSPSRNRIFTCRPLTPNDETTCASKIISTLARRAFRRPVRSNDMNILLSFFESGRKGKDFDSGIEMALRRILVSPDFLFRRESDPADSAPGEAYQISDLELASRLSFFLWSSIPDDELLDIAAKGMLRNPTVLSRQVKRMLADVRARALVDNFGGQWLYTRNINFVTPDTKAFPDFDANLRQSMSNEMSLFLESQIREDHGVLDLMTADYTFINERLARHYGIPNIYGNHFRKVTLTGKHEIRHGILGKGSLLTVTSYAHRTSPVVRGKWLLENVLGTPPPPPPPDVPTLEENDDPSLSPRSVRERMERHRANPVCASCHNVMDPLGFALENFDGIGRWRDVSEAGTLINASGTLSDGTEVDGPISLRQAFVNRGENFLTTVTEKLLTYAIGRGVESFDAPAVRQIVKNSAEEEYSWSSLIAEIVQSTPFQMRRLPES